MKSLPLMKCLDLCLKFKPYPYLIYYAGYKNCQLQPTCEDTSLEFTSILKKKNQFSGKFDSLCKINSGQIIITHVWKEPTKKSGNLSITQRHSKDKNFNERLLRAPLCSVNISDIGCYADLEVAFQEELDWLEIVNTCFLSTSNNNFFPGCAQHHAGPPTWNQHYPAPIERESFTLHKCKVTAWC